MLLPSPLRLSVTLGALALLLLLAVDSSANMTGKSYKQTASGQAPGMSKVIFKIKLGQGAADAETFTNLDPCISSTAQIDLHIDNSNSTFFSTVAPAGQFWGVKCAETLPGKDTARFDTGNCKFRYIGKFDAGGILLAGKFVAKCLLPVDVALIHSAEIVFIHGANVDNVCFGTAAGGFTHNPATVTKDGSDGKVVKLLNAPLLACENP